MNLLCRRVLLAGLVAGLGILLAPAGRAQNNSKGESVKIPTVDGVELHGVFYPSPKKNAPTVICLHNIGTGENSSKKGWTFLAEALQPKYSVMLFDFRGHGKSTTIQPETFWITPQNRQMIKGSVKKETLDYKEMPRSYYPFLANDLAAVKAFLDRKNNQGACNTSNTILIGAESGATLGAIWLNSEWNRFKLIPPPTGIGFATPSNTPEGRDVIACVWLSLSSQLGSYEIPLTKTLETAGRSGGTGMVFMYGDQDTRAKNVARALEKNLKSRDNKGKFTAAVPVKGNTKLAGEKLLQKALGTDTAIGDYLGAVVDAKGQEWSEREFRKTNYIWRVGGAAVQAKAPTDTSNLSFFDYRQFIGR
jgi:hypothetical protein